MRFGCVYACPGVRYRWSTTVYCEEGWSRGWVGRREDIGDQQGSQESWEGEDPLQMDDRAVMAVLAVWYRYLTCGILLQSGWSVRIRYHNVRSGSHTPLKYRVPALSFLLPDVCTST